MAFPFSPVVYIGDSEKEVKTVSGVNGILDRPVGIFSIYRRPGRIIRPVKPTNNNAGSN